MGSGLRIGELVLLRWPNVDFGRRLVRVVDFRSTLGHELVPSLGKSRDAVRTIDLVDDLAEVLRQQRRRQTEERRADPDWAVTEYVFTVHRTLAAERLGHADPTLFTNLYSHVTPTMQRDAAERIGFALFGALAAGEP